MTEHTHSGPNSQLVTHNHKHGEVNHDHDSLKPFHVWAWQRPDSREPAIALARFNPLGLLRGYGQASGLRCFMFTTAAVYAPDREAAEAFADAHELRGRRASEYHAELS
jgi:hypothetical protein